MSTPLSPLSNNTRIRSPAHTTTTPTIGRVMDMDSGKENVSPSPIKWDSPSPRKEEYKEEAPAAGESTPAQDLLIDGMDDDDVEDSVLEPGPPSSPFQSEVYSTLSQGIANEGSPSKVDGGVLSKKRSHEEICVDEEDENEDELRENQGLTIAVDKMMEEHERKQRCVGSDNDADMEREENVENHERHEESYSHEVGNNTMNEKLNEDMSTVYHDADSDGDSSMAEEGNDAQIEEGNSMDDTCLSTFSAVPNADMTLFSKMRQVSPTKRTREEKWSPSKQARDAQYNASAAPTPGTVRRDVRRNHIPEFDGSSSSPTGSPTPRKGGTVRADDTTNLLDFTDQFNVFAQASQAYKTHNGRISTSPSRRAPRGSPSKSGADGLRTPAKFNLLDFDIPPAPTPRSIPTITPRELESLKSSFLSEISSLKATLSGKEAEVTSLKEAVADAERRVGEAWEEVRNECARKEALEAEQGEWERRGRDMEEVLREIKAQIMEGEQEITKLNKRAEEAEKSKEELEGRIVELDSQLSAARKAAVTSTPSKSTSKSGEATAQISEDTAREVQDAVEKVARELHTLYKGKHETKVAALKKSYEARWEKRVRETEAKLQKAMEENEHLKTQHDATMSGVVPGSNDKHEDVGNTTMNASFIARDADEIEAEKRVIEARLKGMEQEMAAVKQESETLRAELKAERTEKGELVAVVDEWMNMQQQQQQQSEQQQKPAATPERPTPLKSQPTTAKKEPVESARPTTETLTRSIARPGTSGMRPPSAMGSSGIPGAGGERRLGRFGMPGGHNRGNSGGAGAGRSAPLGGASNAGRSGIMSSIERMGRGGGGV
ncbi:hypothetical protein FQN54_002805 [Arachnomyces sp. PD_36]|nr:hypothetical protein FQN54_002805 [Arachnomyces sp. PD_36]